MTAKSQLPLILTTAFLDLLGFSIFIPVLPDITAHFMQDEAWTMWAQSIYSLGMFVAGAYIGKLSDRFGRKNLLIVTSSINIIAYMVTYYSLKTGNHIGIYAFGLYLFGRFIAGVGGSGFGVVQAYISDISSPAEKARNMGLMGAAFGAAFLIGPGLGGVLSHLVGIDGLLIISTVIIAINLLWITFGLPEPRHHLEEMQTEDDKEWKLTREIYFFLFLALLTTIGFSVIQSGSAQYSADRFGFNADLRGYIMVVVGLTSIVFQGFLIKYVRKYLSEPQMMKLGLASLALGMFLYAINPIGALLFFIVVLFPLGMGLFNPSLASMLAQNAGKHAGRVMGTSTSVTGIGGIIGPLLVGWLYHMHITLPFWASGVLFLILMIIVSLYFRRHREATA